jgi:hypothetical protein
MAHVRIFLSTVSAEFRSYRELLRQKLTRPNVTIQVQEDFIATGTETLDLLDRYIRDCDAVIHLVGDMTGAMAQAPSVAWLREHYPDFAHKPLLAEFLAPDGPPLSYTQWEAWLAIYHRKPLFIAVPEEGARRDAGYQLDDAERAAQQAHLQRLATVERYPAIRFPDAIHLVVEMLRSQLLEILSRAGPVETWHNLPYPSLRAHFKGRDEALKDMAQKLGAQPAPGAVRALALTGLGGIGKTRLALEYVWRNLELYSGRLHVGADSAEALSRNLAALSGADILDLIPLHTTHSTLNWRA